MRDCNRTAVTRRQVDQLVAAAEKRAAKAEGTCSNQFRPLTKAETESILGDELLAALGDPRRRASLGEAREARASHPLSGLRWPSLGAGRRVLF
jgi:hypothetical protein